MSGTVDGVWRYPRGAVIADYARAAAGLAVTVPLLVLVPPNAITTTILAGLTVLFAAFALRTLRRQFQRVYLTPDAIAIGRRRLPWATLDRVRLRRFARRSGTGWMEMRLGGAGAQITIDSELPGFLVVARAAFAAAEANHVPLAPATRTNFAALGLRSEDQAESR